MLLYIHGLILAKYNHENQNKSNESWENCGAGSSLLLNDRSHPAPCYVRYWFGNEIRAHHIPAGGC